MEYLVKKLLETLAASAADGSANELANEARRALDDAAAREKHDEEKTAHARQQASAKMDSIAEMVAAVNCDYSRLEELRDELKNLQNEVFDALEAVENADMEQIAARRDNDEFDQNALDDTCESLADAEENLYSFGQLEGEELAELAAAAGEFSDADEARERIQEDPLEIAIKSGWHAPGEAGEDDEFMILLSTGGPAVRIVGELDQYKQPCRAWLECQDWFTAWMEYHGENVDNDALLTYCQQFYFGE